MKVKDVINGLEPYRLWEHFRAICQIPHCSKQETKIQGYVTKIAKESGLTCQTDSTGNVLVRKPASLGLSEQPLLTLQAHTDMVCEKSQDVSHDFTRDPIRLVRDGGYVTARGTTLGADNGIGVAACLAIMESQEIRHGPLEFLLTVGEETGLTGAKCLSANMLRAEVLINLDSVEDDVIYIGCAGSKDTELLLAGEIDPKPPRWQRALIRVGGLTGGHSGLDIHRGRANAIKLLARFLWRVDSQIGLRLANFRGGDRPTAIPREADAIVLTPPEGVQQLSQLAAIYQNAFLNEYAQIEQKLFLKMAISTSDEPTTVLTPESQKRLINLLLVIPHGPMVMSPVFPGQVKTSTNLGVLTMENGMISIQTKQRGSVETELEAVNGIVRACGMLAKAEVKITSSYAPWKPIYESPILKLAKGSYQDRFGRKPETKVMHAGLECGIIKEKYPDLDMLSIGPKILNAHSPDEKVQISSVLKFWGFLITLIAKVAS